MARPKMIEAQKAEAAAKRLALQPIEQAAPVVDVADMPSLAAYIAANERDGIVLTRVTYPQATQHVFPGIYSGIVVADGPLSCTWSDGSKKDS